MFLEQYLSFGESCKVDFPRWITLTFTLPAYKALSAYVCIIYFYIATYALVCVQLTAKYTFPLKFSNK